MTDPCYQPLINLLNEVNNKTLWIVDENLPVDCVSSVRPRSSLSTLTNRVDVSRALENAGLECTLSDFQLTSPQAFDHVLYRISKERAVVHHCIQLAARALEPGGRLTLLGRKNDGIKTDLKYAGDAVGPPVFYKKRGLCYEGALEKEEKSREGFQDNYSSLQRVQAGHLTFCSKPGIFGWNKVDRGSELLIRALRSEQSLNLGGSVLDLGCGWGYLLLATADFPFRQRWATDNNVTALIAARENFRRAGLAVDVSADDCGSQLSGPFDLILCNPPFHQGFDPSEALSRKFVDQTVRLLGRKGKAVFVVNQFIPLEKMAARHFSRIDLLLQQDGFKVFSLGRE